MFKKENLPKLPNKYLVTTSILCGLLLVFPMGIIWKNNTWLTILTILYGISLVGVILSFLVGLFLLFYLRKHDIVTKKIRWGVLINFFTLLLSLLLGSMVSLN